MSKVYCLEVLGHPKFPKNSSNFKIKCLNLITDETVNLKFSSNSKAFSRALDLRIGDVEVFEYRPLFSPESGSWEYYGTHVKIVNDIEKRKDFSMYLI